MSVLQGSKKRMKIIVGGIALSSLALFVGWTLLPYFWMVVTAFRPESEFYRSFSIIPQKFTLDNFIYLFTRFSYFKFFFNSVKVTMISTVISLIISVFAAYAIARLTFKGNKVIGKAVFFTYLLPQAVLVIPLYLLLNYMHTINTLWSLYISYPIAIVPFCTWLLIGYFSKIPRELDEAAMIDGTSRMGVLFRIVLPLSGPGLTATAIFSIVNAWNQYLYPLVFTSNDADRVLTVALPAFIMGDIYVWGALMAAALVTAFPFLILFIALQKFVVGGMTAGAVKG